MQYMKSAKIYTRTNENRRALGISPSLLPQKKYTKGNADYAQTGIVK